MSYDHDPESYPQRRIRRWSDDAIRAAAFAKGPGTRIVWSDDSTLLLDLDGGEEGVETFKRQLALLEDTLPQPTFGEYTITLSRSGRNHHVTVKLLTPMPVQNRILLQALLGSDIKREALSFAGLINGQPNPVVFFERTPDLTDGELDPPGVTTQPDGTKIVDLMAALKASLAKGK